ncbi:MAG: methyltransferase domain-containing protein [Rhizomicrobium sp.]
MTATLDPASDEEAGGNDRLPAIEFRNPVRKLVRRLLDVLGLNFRQSLTPGISLFGTNVFRDSRPGPLRFFSAYALDYAIGLHPSSVLDVGSGGGYHARAFLERGSTVLCVDYGTSIYATKTNVRGLDVIEVDFNKFETSQKFDLVWASHILEHQRNIGSFIERLIACCSPDGHVCITLPDPHRALHGGHLSLWSPGLLAYNVALCGVDISDAVFVRGSNEFSMFFRPKAVPLPGNLTYDNGDLDLLAKSLPQNLSEDADPWAVTYETASSR